MYKVNIHEAKTNLSKLVEKAVDGESFVIAKAGKPMVKVIPYTPHSEPIKRIGFLRGMVNVPDDFDTFGEDAILSMFGEEK